MRGARDFPRVEFLLLLFSFQDKISFQRFETMNYFERVCGRHFRGAARGSGAVKRFTKLIALQAKPHANSFRESGIGRCERQAQLAREKRAETLIDGTDHGGFGMRPLVEATYRVNEFEWPEPRNCSRHGDGPAATAEGEQYRETQDCDLQETPCHGGFLDVGPKGSALAVKIFVPINCSLPGCVAGWRT